jgi:hypothetical protein
MPRGGRRIRPTPSRRVSAGEGKPDTTPSHPCRYSPFSIPAPKAGDVPRSILARKKASRHSLDLTPLRLNRRPLAQRRSPNPAGQNMTTALRKSDGRIRSWPRRRRPKRMSPRAGSGDPWGVHPIASSVDSRGCCSCRGCLRGLGSCCDRRSPAPRSPCSRPPL